MKILSLAGVVALGIATIIAIRLGNLTFFEVHEVKKIISQEDRRAEAVGAKPLPKEPIKVEIQNNKRSCLSITAAEIEGSSLVANWHTGCGGGKVWLEIHWKAYSPDGTVLFTDFAFAAAGDSISAGENGEFTYSVKADPRISRLVVSGSGSYY